jgi:hypothetical protein
MRITISTVILLASFGSGAPTHLPPLLPDYSGWRVISPPGHAVPAQIAALCVAPVPPPNDQAVLAFGPHANTFVRVSLIGWLRRP